MKIIKKLGRPRKEKETVIIKRGRGRPKKSEEILEKRRTISFKDLYPKEKEKVKLRAGVSPGDTDLHSGYAEEWKEIYKKPDESQKKNILKDREDINQIKIELSHEVKEAIAREALGIDETKEPVYANLKIVEESEQASSHMESINKLLKIKSPNDPPYGKGNTASPGRPKGSRNRSTLALELIGQECAEAVYKKLVALALEGDVNACKIIIDRVCPARKGYRHNLGYEGAINTVQQVNDLSKHVLKMVVEGEISTDEADAYGKLIEQRLKIIVDTDMAAKIENTCQQVELIRRGV